MAARLGCVLGVGVLWLMAQSAIKAQDGKKALADLQGTWKVVGFEVNGEEAEFPSNLARWVIKGDKVLYAGELLATLTLYPDTSPRGVDLAFDNPKRVCEGIYSADGDKLKLCVNRRSEAVKERPLDFETKDKPGLRLLVLERQKPGSSDGTKEAPGFVGIQIATDPETKKVRIGGVLKDSPAEKAGLKKDDLILKVGGGDATDLKTVVDLCRQARPGADLIVRVERDGKATDITVRVRVLPFFLLDGE
jgi:uncharacterized protein (TIGR03067 family)